MLSNCVEWMIRRLEPYRTTGLQASPEMVARALKLLRSLADDVRELEGSPARDGHRGSPALSRQRLRIIEGEEQEGKRHADD